MGEIASPPRPPEIPRVSTVKPAEKAPAPPVDVARVKSARGKLEQIAKGVTVNEALTAPAETGPDRETMTGLLNESNALLLDLKDARLIVNAIATQAVDTPLGNEVRTDALRSLLTMNAEGLPPEQSVRVLELQNKVKALNLPDPKPEESAALGLLTTYNEQHPDAPVPTGVIDAIRSGKKDTAPTVAQLLQTNGALAQMTWKELTGMDTFAGIPMRPDIVLDLAGIAKTEENMKKAAELFGSAKQIKEPAAFGEKAFMGAMYGALALMFVTQIATGEGSSGGGH